MATAQKKPVLFLTNSEYGQAQVALAIAHQLLQHPQIQVHIASFPELEPRVQQLQGAIPNDESDATAGETAELAFHTLPAPSMRIAYGTTGGHARFMSHPYGIRHAANSYKYLTEVLSPWSWEQYLAIYGRCDALVEEIEPELVVCDSILSPALDFCRNGLGRTKGVERKARFVVLSPLDILHTCSLAQGLWRSLFRLPA